MGGTCSALAQCVDFYVDGLSLRQTELSENDCGLGYFAYSSQKRSDCGYLRLGKNFEMTLEVLDSCSAVFVYSYSPEPPQGQRLKSSRKPQVQVYHPGDVIELSGRNRIDHLITCVYSLENTIHKATDDLSKVQEQQLLSLHAEFIDSTVYPPDYKTARQMTKAFERTLLKVLMEPSYEGWGATLFKTTGKPLPEGLAIADAYIVENPAWEFCVDQLAEMTGMSERTVYYQFKKYRQMSPYRYYLIQRLYHVRQQILMNHTSEDKIGYHAFNAGFHHLGRFSSMYKKTFGELPVKTRTRRKLMNGASKTALMNSNG